MEYKDYYKIMGVARDASQEEIKRAYRLLARKYHPDVSKEVDAEAHFKEIGEANEVLKDAEKRAAYDQLGSNWKGGQEFRPPPDWNSGFEFSGNGGAAQFSDFFESLYGRGFADQHSERSSANTKGADHHAKVLIDLEDSYNGTTRSITLQAPKTDSLGRVTLQAHTLNVNIPRGIRSGQHIRLSGQGSPQQGQGKAGDLYLEIEFRPHLLYRIEQQDIYLNLPVTPWELALGASLKTPTPSGLVEIKIPAGATNGNKLRIKGRGIPSATPGDFYVVLKLTLPPATTDEEQNFYRIMATQFKSFNPRSHLGV